MAAPMTTSSASLHRRETLAILGRGGIGASHSARNSTHPSRMREADAEHDRRDRDRHSSSQPPCARRRASGGGCCKRLFSLVLVIAIFVFVLPQVADISKVWDEIRAMTWLELTTLVVIALWNLATYWFVWVACLPGLSVAQAAVASEASTAVANTVPGGSYMAVGHHLRDVPLVGLPPLGHHASRCSSRASSTTSPSWPCRCWRSCVSPCRATSPRGG